MFLSKQKNVIDGQKVVIQDQTGYKIGKVVVELERRLTNTNVKISQLSAVICYKPITC